MKTSRLLMTVLTCMAFSAAAPVFAKDLGVRGTVYPITEVDMRVLIAESVSRIDQKKVQKEIETSVDRYFENQPKRFLPVIGKTRLDAVSVEVTIQDDIKAPFKNAKGEIEWRVVYKKGTKVNALERYKPVTQLLFFSGNSKEQVAFVKQVLAKYPRTVVPIEVSGANIKPLIEELGRMVFIVQPDMMNTLNLQFSPALVFGSHPTEPNKLGRVYLSSPFKMTELDPFIPAAPNGVKASQSNSKPSTTPKTK